MNLKETLLRGIYAYGFEKPSAIQQRAIIPCIKGTVNKFIWLFHCSEWNDALPSFGTYPFMGITLFPLITQYCSFISSMNCVNTFKTDLPQFWSFFYIPLIVFSLTESCYILYCHESLCKTGHLCKTEL